MIRSRHLALCAILLLAISSGVIAADLSFSRHYSDNMVLQREKPVLIRGFADKGATVTVTFAGQAKEAKADENGEWSVTLDALKANAEGQTLTAVSSIKNQKSEIKNVVVGDVFLFARQTTIDISLGRDEAGKKAATDVKSVRVITIKTVPAYDPQKDLAQEATSAWTALTKDAALKMDAAAFYVAKDLAAKTEVPIGIINVNLGRHFPIGWMSKEALSKTKEFFGEVKGVGQVDSLIKNMNKAVAEERRGTQDTKRGYPRPPVKEDARYPAAGYNAVLHPMRGLALKGVLLQLGNDYPYYSYVMIEREGKGNSRDHLSQAYQDSYYIRKDSLYTEPFTIPRLPKEWRKTFGDAALPIGLITPPGSELATLGRHHYEVREVQRRTADKEAGVDLILPGSKCVPFSAQPADDALLGARCVTWLQGAVYKQKGVVPTGPVFDRVETNGSTAQIFFKPGTAVGLTAAAGALGHFEVAAANTGNPAIAPNENLTYTPAKAIIDGETIRLSSDTVETIAYVRYNWKEKPDQGLIGANGLPAVPFNTDGHRFPKRISMMGEEPELPEFSTSITEWDTDGPVVYNGRLDTRLTEGDLLGPTGLRVTPFGPNLYVNNAYAGSPADGKILPGDYLYAVNGKPFGNDMISEIAEAINLAETEEAKGVMSFALLRNNKKMTVEIQLEVLGTFSETSPYNCPKTDRLVAKAEAQLAKFGGTTLGRGRFAGHPQFMNADSMFLLAAGSPEYQGLVRRQVYSRLSNRDPNWEVPDFPMPPHEMKKLPRDKQPPKLGGPWDISADLLLISEYYLATGDTNVLPYLKQLCDAMTAIQIRRQDEKGPWPDVYSPGQTGGWRHNFYGGAGYGCMPAIGVPASLGYQLTKEAGVQYKFLGCERAAGWFLHNGARAGTSLYGYRNEPVPERVKPIDPDQLAAGKLNPANGGVAGAAILFKLRGNNAVSETCAHVATHCYNNTAYAHGGHFWLNLYTPLGAKVHGETSFKLYMKGNRNYQTIHRLPDGSRDHGEFGFGYGQYLAYVAPRERLRILGAHESVFAPNPPAALTAALEAYYKRDYAACEATVKAVLAKGGLQGLDLKKAEQLRDQTVLIQKSIASDVARVQKLIAEKKPYEAGLDLDQLKAVMPEGSAELAAIETVLNQGDMKRLVGADQKRYHEYRASLPMKLPTEVAGQDGPQWQDLISQCKGRFAFKSRKPLPKPTTWRIKTLETITLAPEGWMDRDFDDSSWGEVQLPISWRENHTALLRAPFEVADPSTIKALRLNQFAKRLDNTRIYINGKLVAKISGAGGGGTISVPLNDIALGALKKGRNVLAVTYKNNWRWGTYDRGAGSVTLGGLNLTLEMQEE